MNLTALVLFALILIPACGLAAALLYLILRRSKKSGLHCPSCGRTVKAHYRVCPYCSADLTRKED